MTLATHAVIGAAIASSMPNHPLLGFSLAFASHFLLDAIPHWDYPLSSLESDGNDLMDLDMPVKNGFFGDLVRIGLDVSIGIVLALIFFGIYAPHLFWVPLLGAAGAVLPDALQFAYWKWRHQPLISLQRFHLWMHAKKDFNGRPLVGIPLQAIVIAFTIVVFKLFV